MSKDDPRHIRSSAAEYLTFVAAAGDQSDSFEVRFENEDIWLTQKMMVEDYGVTKQTINEHLQRIYADDELEVAATVREYLTVQTEGARSVSFDRFIAVTDRKVLDDSGGVTAEIAHAHTEAQFEKYRIVQDRLFESDFDRFERLQEAKEVDTEIRGHA